MESPTSMKVLEGYAHYSPEGVVTFDETVALIAQAIRFCRDHQIALLLVDSRKLTGFPPPLLPERYWMAQEWASAAKGTVILSLVARTELIDQQRFGLLAAKNAGLTAFISDSNTEALAWLLEHKTH